MPQRARKRSTYEMCNKTAQVTGAKKEDAISLARAEEEPEAAARKLTETAFSRGSGDNITCIVVRFYHDKVENETPIGDQVS